MYKGSRISSLARTAQNVRLKLSERADGYVELMEKHYMQTITTSGSTTTAVSNTITKACRVNVELSGTVMGNVITKAQCKCIQFFKIT
jgi:uncharacterized protein YqeY